MAQVASQLPGGARMTPKQVAQHCAEDVARLSQHFTAEREALPAGYLTRPATRSAYLLYFGLTGAATVQRAMDLAGAWPAAGAAGVRVLDVGAGPLVASLGIAERLPAQMALEVTAVDGAKSALHDGAAVLQRLRPTATTVLRAGNFRERAFFHQAVAGRYDVIVMANVLNEWQLGGRKTVAPGEFVYQLLRHHLAENGVAVFVEPATRAGSHALIGVRETLAEAQMPILAPCCGAEHCPLAESHRDWCFSEQPWQRPDPVAWIDAAIGHQRGTLKFSYLAVGNRPAPSGLRVIGGPMRAAGIIRRYVCGPMGRVTAAAAEKAAPAWMHSAWRGDLVSEAALGTIAASESGRREQASDVSLPAKSGRPVTGNPPAAAGPSRSSQTKRR